MHVRRVCVCVCVYACICGFVHVRVCVPVCLCVRTLVLLKKEKSKFSTPSLAYLISTCLYIFVGRCAFRGGTGLPECGEGELGAARAGLDGMAEGEWRECAIVSDSHN